MKTVMVVEDDLDYQELLKKKLEEEGYTVILAGNGEEALEFVKKTQIDMILLDLLMPKMDGINFYYKLTSVLQRSTPVIILTNLSEAAYSTGIKDFLIKSDTSLDEIASKVKKNLE